MTETKFPGTLREFGHDFDAGGKLRKIDEATGMTTDESFQFNVSEDPTYNQKRYEALGEVINHYVYDLLEKEGLKRLSVPRDSLIPTDLRSFIFASDDAMENNKLILFIHGNGVVRAGQWARRLIINDSLQTGTQIPYIQRAKQCGYGVLVLNTNDNQRTINGKLRDIKGSGTPHEHLETVWHDYVRPAEATHIAIVAHSYGGECAVKFALNHDDEFKKRVFAVGLTDSVHRAPLDGFDHVIKISRNWACSDKPLDTPVLSLHGDIERVSAGHTVHEMSSSSCMDSLFQFIEDRYQRVVGSDES